MSTTLKKLNERAKKTGEAILNGRMRFYAGPAGELREKFAITYNGDRATLRHWGTQTLELDLENKKVTKWYGESASDASSMNWFLRENGITDCYFSFRPVNGGFQIQYKGGE